MVRINLEKCIVFFHRFIDSNIFMTIIQIWDFWVLVLCCISRFFNSRRWFCEILMLLWLDVSFFPYSRKRRLHFQVVANSLKRWEIAIFEVAYMLYFSDFGDYFFRHGIFVGERKRGIQFRDCTLRRTEGGRRVFAWAMKYFRHKLMSHEMFLKIFDEPQFFLCFHVLIVLNDFI